MSFSQFSHSDACINLFVYLESNGRKYKRLFYHQPMVTMISDFYKEYIPRKSKRTIIGIPRDSNVPPVTET